MWLLVGGLALAGLRADLDAASQGSPDAVVVCTSARTAWSLLGRVMEASAEGQAGVGPARVFREGSADALFDEQARIAVSWWRESGQMQIGFDTSQTAEQVARAFASMDTLGKSEALQGPEGWQVQSGEALRQVRVKDGWAKIFEGSPPGDAVRVLPKGIVDAMPEDPGCVGVMHVVDAEMGELDVGVHLPFAHGEPTTFALAGKPVDAFGGVVFRAGVPRDVRTPEAPEAMAVLGLGMDGIDFSTFLTGKELRRARRLQNRFPVTAGSTVAILATDPSPVVAAMLPLPERYRARKVARRARRLLKSQDFAVEKVDATHFSATAGPAQILFAAQQGALLLSTDANALAAMEDGKGAPWVDPHVADLAGRYPFVVSTRVLPHGRGMPLEHLDEPATLALDLKPGLVTGEVYLPFSFDEILDRAKEGQAVSGMEADAEPDE